MNHPVRDEIAKTKLGLQGAFMIDSNLFPRLLSLSVRVARRRLGDMGALRFKSAPYHDNPQPESSPRDACGLIGSITPELVPSQSVVLEGHG